MTGATLIWRNLGRNPTRTGLTVLSLALSLFLDTMLNATVASMSAVATDSAAHLRLVVHNHTSMTQLLPLRCGPQIAALPGTRAVCGVRWFGGRVANSQAEFPSLATDPTTFPMVFDEVVLTDAERADWLRERTAAIVGVGLAQRMNWHVGDRVTLRGGVPPYLSLEFHIVAITDAAAYPNMFLLRLDYLLDAMRADGRMPARHNNAVNFYWVKANSATALEPLRSAIDESFANSSDPTRTELEEAFVTQFTRMFGDIPLIVRGVGLVVVASILVIAGHTISMSVQERLGELAVLKALGFSTPRILAGLIGESVLIGLSGALLGCLPALMLFGLSSGAGLSMPYFPIIAVSPTTVVTGVAVGVLIGLLAAALPARRVARLSVTNTLRELA